MLCDTAKLYVQRSGTKIDRIAGQLDAQVIEWMDGPVGRVRYRAQLQQWIECPINKTGSRLLAWSVFRA